MLATDSTSDFSTTSEVDMLRAKVRLQEQQLAEHRVSLQLLYNSSETLAELLDPTTLAQRALALICKDLAVLRGEIFAVTQEGELQLLALNGYTVEYASLLRQRAEMRLQKGLAWQVLQGGKPVIMRDTNCSEQWVPIPEVDDGICSAAGLPLIVDEKVVGVISLLSDENDFFTEERLPLLTTLAAPVALALQNARLYSAEKEARKVAEILRAANLASTNTLAYETILSLTLDYLSQLLEYDCATVLLCDQQDLVVSAHREATPASPATLPESHFSVLRYPYFKALLTTQKRLLVRDTAALAKANVLPSWICGRSWLGIPMVVSGESMGILSIERYPANAFTLEQCRIAEALTTQVTVAVYNARLFSQVQSSQQHLRLLAEQLLTNQEEERRRIARELHDEAGQALTALKVSVRAISDELTANPETAQTFLASAERLLDQTMEQIRQLAYGLRPPELDTVGLDATLEHLCQEFAARTGIGVIYQGVELEGLPEPASISLYRFVQEALTNVAKHAKATQVQVRLAVPDGRTTLSVEDDGVGFVPSTPITPTSSLGLGLLGMRERFESLQGHVIIDSAPGRGSKLTATLPWIHAK
ncbi:MAG: GAF domain-containing protein [Caldilineaceae bacterium]